MKTSHRDHLTRPCRHASRGLGVASTSLLLACASTSDPHTHQHHGAMQHRFDDPAKWAPMFDAPERDAWQRPDEVVALVQPMPGQTVADVGAGTGYFMARLSRAVGEGGRVVCVDIEPKMVEYMTARAEREGLKNVEARVGTVDEPKLEPGSTDRILIVDTWHHIEKRGAYAAKLREALAPGGAVFVVDFDDQTERGPPKAHRLSPDVVIAELREGGLEAEVIAETLPDQYVVRGKRP